ncbi:MAG: hypothetical protein ACP5GL_08530, partial [Infirmifilum sp.]
VFVVTNGTYRWHVDLPPGYVASRSNGNVSTNDTITTVTIYTTALPLGPYTYQILYGLAIGTAVSVLVLVLRHRRKGRGGMKDDKVGK